MTLTTETGSPPKKYGMCYEGHPPFEIEPGIVIYGGSCSSPVVKDADVYIGFDSSMKQTSRAFPWTSGHEVYFRITDGDAPKDADEFKALVNWTAEQLRAGKKVHAGCIGGHGRTGTFLAALFATMTGRKDAAQVVRDTYCQKAIETKVQIDFLEKHYGVERVSTRPHSQPSNGKKGQKSMSEWLESNGLSKTATLNQKMTTGKPMSVSGHIWGKYSPRKRELV